MSEAVYRKKLSEIEEIPAPDDLIAGKAIWFPVNLTGSGAMKRGMLLQSDGQNIFEKAQSGFESAKELCILSEDIELEDNETAITGAYFDAEVNAERIILPEGQELNASVKASLRQHGLYVR